MYANILHCNTLTKQLMYSIGKYHFILISLYQGIKSVSSVHLKILKSDFVIKNSKSKEMVFRRINFQFPSFRSQPDLSKILEKEKTADEKVEENDDVEHQLADSDNEVNSKSIQVLLLIFLL